MKSVLVSLGANLGNSHAAINAAAIRLREHFGSANVQLSSLLCCPAIGGPGGQDDFHNAVASIRFDGNVFELWHSLRQIEKDLGRERRHRWESRRIDLDILIFAQLRLWTPHLKIPHPRMITRSFAILPAAELLPQAVETVSQMSLQEIANRLPYLYAPEEQRLVRESPTAKTDRPRQIMLFCVGSPLTEALRKLLPDAVSPWFDVKLETVEPSSARDQLQSQMNRAVTGDVALIVVAIVCPEPSVAAWEDFSRPLSKWMGFEGTPEDTIKLNYNAPRYLLNCFDLNWALHELEAAASAMSCQLSFANPGWTI